MKPLKLKQALIKEDSDSYYKNWLNKVKFDGEYPASFKFFWDGGSTNNLNLNKQSAKILMKWLNDNINNFPEFQ